MRTPAGRDQRSAGVETEGAAGERDSSRGEGWVQLGVGDLVDALNAEGGSCGQSCERQLNLADAVAAMDQDAFGGGEGDAGDWGATDLCGELCEVVERRVWRRVEDLISIEGLETQGFTARCFAFWQCAVHRT